MQAQDAPGLHGESREPWERAYPHVEGLLLVPVRHTLSPKRWTRPAPAASRALPKERLRATAWRDEGGEVTLVGTSADCVRRRWEATPAQKMSDPQKSKTKIKEMLICFNFLQCLWRQLCAKMLRGPEKPKWSKKSLWD